MPNFQSLEVGGSKISNPWNCARDGEKPEATANYRLYSMKALLNMFLAVPLVAFAAGPPASQRAFIENRCYDCHDSDGKKGGLDLSALNFDLTNATTFAEWVRVYDRVHNGEMPPKKKKQPEREERDAFTKTLAASLVAAEQEQTKVSGRAVWRRMNRYEYENTLRDLFDAPWLQVRDMLPEDGESHRFNKSGEALDISHVQLSRYLNAADYALREAMAPHAERPATTTKRFYTRDEPGFTGKYDVGGPENRKTFPVVGTHGDLDSWADGKPKVFSSKDPKVREEEGVGIVMSTYEPTEIRFGKFRAPVSGHYKIRFLANSIWVAPKSPQKVQDPDFKKISRSERSEPVTIYSDTEPRILRELGHFDAEPDAKVAELDVWLLAGETIRPDASRFFRSRPPDHKNPLATTNGAPGVSFRWMEVEGPFYDQWPIAGHKLLFADLPMKDREVEEPPTVEKTKAGKPKKPRYEKPAGVEIASQDVPHDAERLMRKFLEKAYRRPVTNDDLLRFLPVVHDAWKSEESFSEAMIAGYTAALCSPAFLYLEEKPGRLDDRAIASRLSYFLWNSCPDDELRRLAESGELHRPETLRAQTERMLNDPKSRRFVNAFTDYWLDLRKIAATAPDATIYPDYQLDDLLVESMIGETQSFFAELLQKNLGAKNIIASDFAILNERLATHYGIPGVDGVALRRVPLPADSVRGGLLTQASVLKVTANGTTTSPVIRGAWIMERILGQPIPPPPAKVPAIDPDTRGATTIREQLAKHRSQESCAVCHSKMDPAGFALESFDVMGGFRDRYRALGDGEKVKGIGHNGLTFAFHEGPAVDASGELSDGRKFADVRELKQMLEQNEEQLARNLTQQLMLYATGAQVRFSDRPQIDSILARSKPSGYGVRTLVEEIVQSDLFQTK